jgi:protein-tyrosine phosphatase
LVGDKYFHKLQLIRTFEPGSPSDIVPDPYYGNLSDFEKVYFMLEKSILHWLAQQPLEKK